MSGFLIYTCYNATGDIIYVGYSGRGEQRVREHQRRSPWFGEVTQIVREWYGTHIEAAQREVSLIASARPRYNRVVRSHGFYAAGGDRGGSASSRMTLTQAAEYLGLKSTSTLRMQIARGALAAELVGKTYIIEDAEVERYRQMHLHQQGKRTPAPGRKAKEGA